MDYLEWRKSLEAQGKYYEKTFARERAIAGIKRELDMEDWGFDFDSPRDTKLGSGSRSTKTGVRRDLRRQRRRMRPFKQARRAEQKAIISNMVEKMRSTDIRPKEAFMTPELKASIHKHISTAVHKALKK